MAAPTGLTIKSNIEDMIIGDCIPFRYTATSETAGTISKLGSCTAAEIPVIGSATPDGLAYFIKADKGLLIADRVVQHSISWNTLNNAGYIEGKLPWENIINISLGNANPALTYKGTTNNINKYNSFYCSASLYAYRAYVSKLLLYDENNIFIPETEYKLIGSEYVFNYPKIISKVEVKVANPEENWSSPNTLHLYAKQFDKVIRSLTGGNAYLGSDGKASLTDQGLGAYPINNEWDKYIVKSSLKGKITPGDDSVWHLNGWCWAQDTPANGVWNLVGSVTASSNYKTLRGYSGDGKGVRRFDTITSNFANANGGFRPVLEYLEPNAKAITLWY